MKFGKIQYICLEEEKTSPVMANFDPKSSVHDFLYRHPSLRTMFEEKASAVDDGQTVEEFCFANGVDVVAFFRELDDAIDAESREQEAERQELAEARRAAEEKATAEEKPAVAVHAPAVVALLIAALLLFFASAVANAFPSLSSLRSVLGIRASLNLPHISQILCVMNAASVAGIVLLLLWRKLGIVFLFTGAMLNDILVVALTDGLPVATLVATVICATILYLKIDGTPYREFFR